MRSVISLTSQMCRAGARSKRDDWLMDLTAEIIHDPENQREREAQNNAGDNRKIKSSMAALIGDVSGKAAEAKRKTRAEKQERAGSDKQDADDEQQLSEFAQRVHTLLRWEPFYPNCGHPSRSTDTSPLELHKSCYLYK